MKWDSLGEVWFSGLTVGYEMSPYIMFNRVNQYELRQNKGKVQVSLRFRLEDATLETIIVPDGLLDLTTQKSNPVAY